MGNAIAQKIPEGKSHYSEYLTEKNTEMLLLSTVDEDEVSSIASSFKK